MLLFILGTKRCSLHFSKITLGKNFFVQLHKSKKIFFIQTRSITPEFICPPRPHNQSPSPPRLPPSPLDDDLKKGPGLATQTSFDSDYHTDDFSNFTSSDLPSSYVNLARGGSDPDFSRRNQPTSKFVLFSFPSTAFQGGGASFFMYCHCLLNKMP